MENYNKKSIWKWVLLYILIGAVVYVLIYYFFFFKKGYNYNTQNYQSNYQAQNNETADSSTKVLATEDWKTYKNDEYGFQIVLDKPVTDYKIDVTTETRHIIGSSLTLYIPTVSFQLPTQDPEYIENNIQLMFRPISILIVPKENNQTYLDSEKDFSFHSTKIGENNKNVFYAFVFPYCPIDYQNCNPESYANILKSFKITK